MRLFEFIREAKTSYQPPEINIGDEVKVGKFKNRRAEVKGFATDDNNQPVLKTTKGDQKLFKPRISKLEQPVNEARAVLPNEIDAPMKDTFILPGLPSQDPYKTYRFGVALARARGEMQNERDGLPPFSEEGAFGEYAVVSGFDDSVAPLIDKALAMSGISGGKIAVSKNSSKDPSTTNNISPVATFRGYPR
jgi:hypothetical protein